MKTDLTITPNIAEQFTITSAIYLDPLSLSISSQIRNMIFNSSPNIQGTMYTALQVTL